MKKKFNIEIIEFSPKIGDSSTGEYQQRVALHKLEERNSYS